MCWRCVQGETYDFSLSYLNDSCLHVTLSQNLNCQQSMWAAENLLHFVFLKIFRTYYPPSLCLALVVFSLSLQHLCSAAHVKLWVWSFYNSARENKSVVWRVWALSCVSAAEQWQFKAQCLCFCIKAWSEMFVSCRMTRALLLQSSSSSSSLYTTLCRWRTFISLLKSCQNNRMKKNKASAACWSKSLQLLLLSSSVHLRPCSQTITAKLQT